ncbi:lysine--tRNA ligase [Candidatus Falkowbacteria bacterium]|nr:lysine--tRNA ligase [Candidatus Falkowbacteria bacterium]
MEDLQRERLDRVKKLELLKSKDVIPYADKFERSHTCLEAGGLEIGTKVTVVGRVMLLRDMGKITFGHIKDYYGKIQFVMRSGDIAPEDYKSFSKTVDMGDFVGLEGEIGKTQKGEISVFVTKYTFLSKALRPLPEKWHGIKDQETKYRKRYLDLISNQETMDRFKFRSDFIWELRKFYNESGFVEVDTPVLCNSASGAMAKPFITHHNALDTDVFLRIAPEIYLKEAIVGGFDKVFEVARSFRNEGMDPSHLQDFTMLEHYASYWDYKENMRFTERMLTIIVQKLKGSLEIEIINREGEKKLIDLSPSWEVISMRDLIKRDSGIDIEEFTTAETLRAEIKKQGLTFDDIDKLGRGNMIDNLYKKVSRVKIINPTFVVNHPIDLSPLARRNDANPMITDRFQLVINGWEIVNAYSELVDPIDQAERFDSQQQLKESGDEEAMAKDNDYVEAMEYGMPPMSGWGMGIERIVALLTEQDNLRDVVLFPLMRPE